MLLEERFCDCFSLSRVQTTIMLNRQWPSALARSQPVTCRSVPFSHGVHYYFSHLRFITLHVVRVLCMRCPANRRFFAYPWPEAEASREKLVCPSRARIFLRPRKRLLLFVGEKTQSLRYQGGIECGDLSTTTGSSGGNRGQIPLVCRAPSFHDTVDDATRESLSGSNENVEKHRKEGRRHSDTTAEGDLQKNASNSNEDDVKILAQHMTRHNFIRVLDVSCKADTPLAGARVLLLDKPGNIHSIYRKYTPLTESYYDILAALPAVVPEGPIGILGLGAGTAARLIHHFWPEIDIHGWELDPGVVQAARKFFDLEELEWKERTVIRDGDTFPVTRKRDSSGKYGPWEDESDEVKINFFLAKGIAPQEKHGRLRVHIGDALSSNAVVVGGFAGLVVDLFAEGAVIPALQEIVTWRQIREKLRPGGRVIVNCGGSCVEAEGLEKKDGGIMMRETIAALAKAFPGELSIMSLSIPSDNSLALTGPSPDLDAWKATLPECLRAGIENWKPFSPL